MKWRAHLRANYVSADHDLIFTVYSARSLEHQSAGRHVCLLGHIILILSQPVFALSTLFRVLSGEATNTNFIVFGLTRPGFEPTIYLTRCECTNHYTTDTVLSIQYHSSWPLVWQMNFFCTSHSQICIYPRRSYECLSHHGQRTCQLCHLLKFLILQMTSERIFGVNRMKCKLYLAAW
jgi:hypothetical protein